MTKKRMNVLILLLFFVLYIACGYITFSSCKSYTISEFQSPTGDVIDKVQGNLDEPEQYCENIDLLVSNVSGSLLDSLNYPFAFAIFDKDGNVVASGSQAIEYNDEFIPIDDYITDDMVAQIKKTFKKLASCSILKMKYNIIDGKTVPTTVTIGDVNTKTTLDLQFNKSVSKEYIAYDSECASVENLENIDEFENIYMDCNNIINSNKYDQKYYKQVLKEVVEPLADSEIKKIKNGNTSGSSYYASQEINSDCIFKFQNEYYYFRVIVKYSPSYNTLLSSQFKGEFTMQSIIFAIVFVISIVLLNKIYTKNSRLNYARQAFTSAAAHELKTPLAVIQNQCECVLENVAPEKNGKYINSIYSESLRMNKLVATLLQYNRLANATKIEKTPCQIENIIQSEIEKYSSLLQCNNIELLVNVKPYKKVNMNENLISLVVDNFLSNAIKHTNGKITIAGTEEKGGYKVSVANEGENIKKEYEKNLWDVFYRTDEARTKNDNNSTGMGLAICKQILQLHKFKFGFNNLQNGVEFYFIIK